MVLSSIVEINSYAHMTTTCVINVNIIVLTQLNGDKKIELQHNLTLR